MGSKSQVLIYHVAATARQQATSQPPGRSMSQNAMLSMMRAIIPGIDKSQIISAPSQLSMPR